MEIIEKDIVVIGSGAGGWAAALTAAEHGAKVAVYEKNNSVGGLSNYPAGLFAVESKVQKRLNIPITRDQIFDTFMQRTRWQADARLVKAFIDKSAATIEWLQQKGIDFEIWPYYQHSDTQLVGHAVKQGHFASLIKKLRNMAEELGTETHLSVSVKKIVKNNGRISGVTVEDNQGGGVTQVNSKSVIIASGGFLQNTEMVKKFVGIDPEKDIMVMKIPSLNLTGDGIQMAWEVGAATDGMALQLVYGQAMGRPDLGVIMNEPPIYPWINQHGERFIDETISFEPTYTANALLRQVNKCAYLIFDSQTKTYLETESIDNGLPVFPVKKASDLEGVFKNLDEKGDKNAFMADSITDLGVKIGIDPGEFQKTIDEYNTFCETGRDLLFGKEPKYLRPVKQPKFFAAKVRPMATGTVGGIKINEKAEVIDTLGKVIPGLYAAGDCANGITAYDFWIAHALAGNPSSFAMNTGRIAAENAIKYSSR